MAINPMQKKARVNFILGMLVMLLIAGVVIAFLVMSMMNLQNEIEKKKAETVNVYTLNQNVKSGQIITTDMITMQQVNKSMVPSNGINDISIIQNYSLKSGDGDNLITDYERTSDGKIIGNPKLYIEIQDENRTKKYVVYKENENDYFYYRNEEEQEDKVYLKLNNVPLVAKVDMNANTVITRELLNKADSLVQDDVRTEEFNTISLPVDLASGDYVDIRLTLPTGQDYLVVSKKETNIPYIDGVEALGTIKMNLTEEERLYINCAIIDNFAIKGSKLYATKYTDPGLQKEAIVTYPPSVETMNLLKNNDNILDEAKEELVNRYTQAYIEFRNNNINPFIDQEEIPDKVEESIINSQETRQKYLDSMVVE